MIPGQYGTVRTGGWAGHAIRIGTHSPVNHAFIYIGGTSIVEAQPHGAQYAHINDYADIHWSDPALTAGQGEHIAYEAELLIGTPYGWPDIAALSLACLGIKPRPIAQYIENQHRLICSQLVDRAYALAGVQLFNDGRLSGQVTPGDLYTLSHVS